MLSKIYIYGLFNPIDATCFYIGKTYKNPNNRLKEHLSTSMGHNRHKDGIIRKIQNIGLEPKIYTLLEIEDYYIKGFDCQFWELVEKYFIKYCRNNLKEPITNQTDGGDGGTTIKLKTICQYDLKGNFIKKWESCQQASINLHISLSNIRMCCLGSIKAAKGFQFRYGENSDNIQQYKRSRYDCKPVLKFSKNDELICEYISLTDAAEKNNIQTSTLWYGIENKNICHGYKWKYL